MAYKIEYDPRGGKYEVRRIYPLRFPGFLCAALVIFLVGTLAFWPAGAQTLREILIPGNDAVTLQALKNMADNLEQDVSLAQALQTFCRDVIYGANLPG